LCPQAAKYQIFQVGGGRPRLAENWSMKKTKPADEDAVADIHLHCMIPTNSKMQSGQ